MTNLLELPGYYKVVILLVFSAEPIPSAGLTQCLELGGSMSENPLVLVNPANILHYNSINYKVIFFTLISVTPAPFY